MIHQAMALHRSQQSPSMKSLFGEYYIFLSNKKENKEGFEL